MDIMWKSKSTKIFGVFYVYETKNEILIETR